MEGSAELEKALEEYVKRQRRESHPAGRTDGGGRWYPSDEERQACCVGVRSPSRTWPWSLMTHCRTLGHVARLHGVDEKALRALVKRAEPKREGGDHYYKAVRLVGAGGHMMSITFYKPIEYQLGMTVEEYPRQNHNGGIYVYDSVEAAQRFADWCGCGHSGDHVILRCRCEGKYCVYGDGVERKLAFHRVTPLEIVT